MSFCPKCGTKVTEEMSFCPKCGAPLKIEQAPAQATRMERRRGEKSEKGEKREKEEKEKGEKGEKGEYGFLGPLIGGLILIFTGLAFYFELSGVINRQIVWAFFFVLLGIVVIIIALYAAFVLTKRHPKP